LYDLEIFSLPTGTKIAFKLKCRLWGDVQQRGGAFVNYFNLLKEYDMRELSTEELDVVVGGTPIIIQ